ncbi:ALDH-like protein [Wilcoxina mikolae CBS 423.85]|nr:ALDH-like protein [Wilcoxina mikolae CBS 423.85]
MDIHGETSLRTADHMNLVLKQPYGVCAVIIPWNSPLILAVAHIGAAVAAGNAVILKSSEKAPLTCCLLAQLIKESGLFPPGLVQIVSGMGPTTGAALASHMEIWKLAFVGSIATGKKIKEMAARSNLKNVTCELGGKSPLIVFDDANLEKAANDAALSIGYNSGQICSASSRVYVHKNIREQFSEAFKVAFQNILSKAGDPLEPTTTQGPQVDALQFQSIMKFLNDAKADGLTPSIGGGRLGEKGFFIEPTIFCDPPEDHAINVREIFGPVVVLHSFTDEAEVLEKANDTEYGLYSSVYTKDISRALRFAKQLESGTVGINCTSPTIGFDVPFGGWKQSGEGRQWGRQGLDGWLETKTVFINLTA